MLRVEIGQILQFRQSIRCTALLPERHFGFWAKHLAANGWVVPDRAHPRDPALNDDEWLLDAMTRAMDKVLKEGLDVRQRNPKPSVGGVSRRSTVARQPTEVSGAGAGCGMASGATRRPGGRLSSRMKTCSDAITRQDASGHSL